ncbi:uncharacterized protein LOC130930997 [Corythoichthys intestinalis]|uniref:uncharacterized protein LOC130930997 n=1 Tax=Corythoichthys intestinalis TaxID=161448 RepID=UPI0025A528DE|nr:uncharacterized protein LOC130930997 [Corythoichthys intestinalis]
MGSGTSRGTKVAPAGLGGEAKKASSTAKRDAFDALRTHAGRRAPVDCHSAGHDSELSGDDDDADAELDAEMAGYDEAGTAVRRKGKKNPAPSKKAFTRSRTYGLCHFSSGEEDEQPRGASSSSSSGLGGAQGPQGSRGAASNKSDRDAFASPHNRSPQAILTTGPTEEDVPLSQTQITSGHSTPLATPVILYDGSEEELMDTIEREFS